MIHKRHFFHASGFDPYDVVALHRRFARELKRFAATWNVTAAVSPLREDGGVDGHWTVTVAGPGWQVETHYEQLDWSDIVRAEMARPAGRRLWDGLVTLVDLIATGTAGRYFKANWRYGMFFLIPFLNVVLFGVIAVIAAIAVGRTIANAMHAGMVGSGLASFSGAIAGVIVAVLVFALLLRRPGERWRVGQAFADWIFARDWMLGRRPDMEARVAAFAERVTACARRGEVDEIVIAGHSLGATVAIDLVARALAADPALGRHGPSVCVLTIGATVPKLALHPKGEWVRAAARKVADEPSLAWAEYQARDDFISFHKFDPVQLCRIDRMREPSGVAVRRVQIHEMLDDATLRRLRFNYMRMHYQFVMANERRTPYDYFMLLGGPVPFRQVVDAPNGPADFFADDGSLRGEAASSAGSTMAPTAASATTAAPSTAAPSTASSASLS